MNLVKKNSKYIIMILIVSIFAYTIIFKGNFSIIIDAIRECNYGYVSLCACMALAYYLLDAVSITLYTRIYERTYSFFKGLVIAFISPFFNGITPFASGGQVAQVYVFNKQGIDTSTSIGIMLMHFIIYQSALVLYTAGILILQFQYFKSNFTELFFLGIIGFIANFSVITALLCGALSARFQKFVVDVIFKFGHSLHLIKDYDKQVEKYTLQLADFREKLKLLFEHKQILLTSLLINVVRLSIIYMVPYYAFQALHIDTSSVRFYVFIGVTSFIAMMTSFIPIPGASGGSEGLFTTMFGLLFGNSQSRLAMLVWRFVTYYLMMFVGFFTFLYSENKYSKKEEKA